MKCRACGDPNGRRYRCCRDKPVFCNVCKDLHDRRVHPGRGLDDDEPGDFEEEEEDEDRDEDAELWEDDEEND